MDVFRRFDDIDLLHPLMQGPVRQLCLLLDEATEKRNTHAWRVFETWRTPQRQDALLDDQRTRARPWRSAHQYGLAVDIVPLIDGKFSWLDSHDWDQLGKLARDVGLRQPLFWDKCHIQHPQYEELAALGFLK